MQWRPVARQPSSDIAADGLGTKLSECPRIDLVVRGGPESPFAPAKGCSRGARADNEEPAALPEPP